MDCSVICNWIGSPRDVLGWIIRFQSILNGVRAVPVFVIEDYYIMIMVFASSMFLLSGSHGLKSIARRFLFIYCIGMTGASFGDSLRLASLVRAELAKDFNLSRNLKQLNFAEGIYITIVGILLALNMLGIAVALKVQAIFAEYTFQDKLAIMSRDRGIAAQAEKKSTLSLKFFTRAFRSATSSSSSLSSSSASAASAAAPDMHIISCRPRGTVTHPDTVLSVDTDTAAASSYQQGAGAATNQNQSNDDFRSYPSSPAVFSHLAPLPALAISAKVDNAASSGYVPPTIASSSSSSASSSGYVSPTLRPTSVDMRSPRSQALSAASPASLPSPVLLGESATAAALTTPLLSTVSPRASTSIAPSASALTSGSSASESMDASAVLMEISAATTTLQADWVTLNASFDAFDTTTFATNAMHKAKYNIVTFLPLFLFNQFSRLANLYTLATVCLCFFDFSPVGPLSSLTPLLFVLSTSALKEIVEDSRRKAQDRETNERAIEVLQTGPAALQAAALAATARVSRAHAPSMSLRSTAAVSTVHSIVSAPASSLSAEDDNHMTPPSSMIHRGAPVSQQAAVAKPVSMSFDERHHKPSSMSLNNKRAPSLSTRRSSVLVPMVGTVDADECFETRRWQDVRVGDIVRVHADKFFPADLALLACSNANGRCYVETANLDGETNLKLRSAPKETAELCAQGPQTLFDYQFDVQCEQPNASLYVFEGALKLTHLPSLRAKNIALTADQMLLRGTKLRHTEWAVGLVINTGLDTKIEQNATPPPHKQSRVELSVNSQLVFVFVLQTIICMTCSLGYANFQLRAPNKNLPWYLNSSTGTVDTHPFIYASYIILYNSMIPLSMYVTMEVIRFFNARLIASHPRMRVLRRGADSAPSLSASSEPEPEPNQEASNASSPSSSSSSMSAKEAAELKAKEDEEKYLTAQARNASVVEELGQIQYIFSDKTGTLTRNQMILSQCSVAGVLLGEAVKSDSTKPSPLAALSTSVHIPIPEESEAASSSSSSSSASSSASASAAGYMQIQDVSSDQVVTHFLHDQQSNPHHEDDDDAHRQAEALLELEDDPHQIDNDPNAYFVDDDDEAEGGGAYFSDQRLLTMMQPLSRCVAQGVHVEASARLSLVDAEAEVDSETMQYQSALLAREFLLALVLCNTVIPQAPKEQANDDEAGGAATKEKRETRHQQSPSSASPSISSSSSSTHADARFSFPLPDELSRVAADPSTCISDNDALLVYQAGSPDEAALVDGARRMGVVLRTRQGNRVTISFLGKEQVFEVVGTFEFTSDRKRMSVLVRGPIPPASSGSLGSADEAVSRMPVRLYCKGADLVVLARLEDLHPFPNTSLERVNEHLSRMASSGLRTLCIASRSLSVDEATRFERAYTEASLALVKRQQRLEALADEYERDLQLIGITAIEDRLQQGVPECIQQLRDAGIKVWVCTGDKKETAISIGYSSGLLSQEMELLLIDANKADQMHRVLSDIINRHGLTERKEASIFTNILRFFTGEPGTSSLHSLALVIDGPSLAVALQPGLDAKFLTVARACVSVLCCRCSPLQKAAVVDLVKDAGSVVGDTFVTLSIGDGANDVPMIQKAHVGVGINDGKEGMAAVLASDFAIPRFAMLSRLLLLHGSLAYTRISKLILFSFAKNMALAIPQFWFAMVCGYSGQLMYFDFLFTLYNAVFTTVPILTLAMTDEHASPRALLNYPILYRNGIENRAFGWGNFLGWIAQGIWQSMVVFACAFWTAQLSDIGPDGQSLGLWISGTAAYGFLIMIVSLQVSLLTSPRNVGKLVNVLTIVGSIAVFFIFISVYSAFPSLFPDAAFIAYKLFALPAFWLAIPLAVVAALLPNAAIKLSKRTFFPKAHHLLSAIVEAHRNERAQEQARAAATAAAKAQSFSSSSARRTSSIGSHPSSHQHHGQLHDEPTTPRHNRTRSGYAFAQEPGHGVLIYDIHRNLDSSKHAGGGIRLP